MIRLGTSYDWGSVMVMYVICNGCSVGWIGVVEVMCLHGCEYYNYYERHLVVVILCTEVFYL